MRINPGVVPVAILVFGFAVGSLKADTTYDVNYNTVTFDFTTSLSGVSLDNLSDYDIGGTITSNTFSTTTLTEDEGGFPLGTGSSYSSIESGMTLLISTDGSGNLTALDLSGVYFASFPAFPGENPNDFYCTYGVPSGSLITDNDVGFCPASATTDVDFSNASGAPEPATEAMLGAGLMLLWTLRRRWRG